MASLGESVFPHYRQARPSVDTIETSRRAGGRIIAVGTTSVRVLETARASGMLEPLSSNLFHRPNNVRDHRAAAIIVASKHAMSAASRASHCYPAIGAGYAKVTGWNSLRREVFSEYILAVVLADRRSRRWGNCPAPQKYRILMYYQ